VYILSKIKSFRFHYGEILNEKYIVHSKLGQGWEGQVYSVEEISTGIKRAAKFFYPVRNPKNKTLVGYAKKLNTLRDVPIIIKYITQEKFKYKDNEIGYLVSEYVNGKTLDQFVKKELKNRVSLFEALHILYELTKGIEKIHAKGECHGDLHSDNILISRRGVGFKIKLIDFLLLKEKKAEYKKSDIVELVCIFADLLGGRKKYQNLSPLAKSIISGRRSDLILKKFPKISSLRAHIENLDWNL
jgi:serine/threonine protein kinase